MNGNDKARLHYTYLLQHIQEAEGAFKMIEPLMKLLWSDIRGDCPSGEVISELKIWTADMERVIPRIHHDIEEIRQAEQSRVFVKQERMEIDSK